MGANGDRAVDIGKLLGFGMSVKLHVHITATGERNLGGGYVGIVGG